MDFSSQLERARADIAAGQEVVWPMLDSEEVLLQWLTMLTEAGAWQIAWQTARECCGEPHWNERAALQVAICLVCADRLDLAQAALTQLGEHLPDASACFGVGEDIYAGKLYGLATRWLNVLAGIWPSDVRLSLLRGAVAFDEGATVDAIGHFERALFLEPDNDTAYQAVLRSYGQVCDRIPAIKWLPAPKPDCHRATLDGALQAFAALEMWPVLLYLVKRYTSQFPEQADFLQITVAESLTVGGAYGAAERLMRDDISIPWVFARVRYHSLRKNFDRVAAELECLLDREPDHAEAHYHLFFYHCVRGRWKDAWREAEWRFKLPKGVRSFMGPQDYLDLPVWDGQPTSDTIAVCSEQGLGDAVQMLRYLPDVLQRVGGLHFSLPTTLLRLFEGMDMERTQPASEQAVVGKASGVPVARMPLMTLPHLLNCSTPDGCKYLAMHPEVVERTRAWVAKEGLRVGLVWGGNREFQEDHIRSPHFLHLLSLADVEGVTFHILQKGPCLDQVSYAPAHMRIVRTDLQIEDMADLAGVMLNLDLVISMCSMPAHLAGALGVPVWTLLSDRPHFMWKAGGSKTEWYDSMRLFRQPHEGDWAGAVAEMASALRQEVMKRGLNGAARGPLPSRVVVYPAGEPYALTGDLAGDMAHLERLLERDDRHVGAMLGLARLHLAHDDAFRALLWASEAMRYERNNVNAWQLMHEAQCVLDVPQAELVAARIEELRTQGAPLDWFGWRY